MNVFELRERVVGEYAEYVRSFVEIKDPTIRGEVEAELAQGLLWPEPFIGLNPAFEPGAWIDDLVKQGVLHPECARVFRRKEDEQDDGQPLRLHRHQEEAIRLARQGRSYVMTTGTGSGKSLAYMVPIVDHILRNGPGKGIQAIVVYPMNALANSQMLELEKFLQFGYPNAQGPVRFERYTGQENDERKNEVIASRPDILLTNYVMLELILTRVRERPLVEQAKGLHYLVLDELHTYRGRQGADVAYLVRRTREACKAEQVQCVGTSATLSTEGGHHERRSQVAAVATQVFGTQVEATEVVMETLERATPEVDPSDPNVIAALTGRIASKEAPTASFEAFITDPLSSWVEQAVGLWRDDEGRLVRRTPQRLRGDDGAAAKLAGLTGRPHAECIAAIERQLLAGYEIRHPTTDRPAFAFRLHQFLSRGDTVYASLEAPCDRAITVEGQRFVPGSGREKLLYPLVFCRQCGQEYYAVRRLGITDGDVRFEPRAFDDTQKARQGEMDGYLCTGEDPPWPEGEAAYGRLPEDWIEEAPTGTVRVKANQRLRVPRRYHVAADGSTGSDGLTVHFVPRPFRLCLACGVVHAGSQRGDFSKLATLGSGGRSTATTVVSLSAVRWLRDHTTDRELQKVLAFTDNRQDASLQSGHFNDFVQTGLLRAALVRAVDKARADGISHDELAARVFEALALPFDQYASNPHAEFAARKSTEAALRGVLAYRLYRDLKRGWRETAPNLEQCGLLRFRYESLDDLCASHNHWQGFHPALAGATPSTRERVATVLLDFMRRELCLEVDHLDQEFQERLRLQSSQLLLEPWALDENERLEHAGMVLPRPERPGDYRGWTYLSGRGGLARWLRSPSTFPHHSSISMVESERVIRELLEVLQVAGLVQRVVEPRGPGDPGGYQLKASGLRWCAGDGEQGYHDQVRMPLAPERGVRANPYFRQLYQEIPAGGSTIQAKEHTAQVSTEEREVREQRFREGRLPVLYCSPTMELGIDIADLSVVGMRNVPPTAANYAQRSGRAGRANQPALVFTYCSTGSPHDQYFFRRADQMIAGRVPAPRLDLANEDLVRAHVDAIWLAQSHLSLGRGLTDVLDASGDQPTFSLQPHVEQALQDLHHRQRAVERAQAALADVMPRLERELGEGWLAQTLATIPLRFEQACIRWRGLYEAALHDARAQSKIILDATRPPNEKRQAERRRQQAESQLRLLTTEADEGLQADFGSYRYFATEGFVPGYSFPRLPLTAWIPGRRGGVGRDDYLQRPRFLAISEFGPRNVLYHEGSRYVIDQVQVPRDPTAAPGESGVLTEAVKRCHICGYLHPVHDGQAVDLCESCGAELGVPLGSLLRLQHVIARRRDRINADEEERQRHGYEVLTGVRFASREGHESVRTAEVVSAEGALATLLFAPTATLSRINIGWRRRDPHEPLGFRLDVERGTWARGQDDDDDDDGNGEGDLEGRRVQRVVPFVEDRRNCLIYIPASGLEPAVAASLQAALRMAIGAEYQLEDSELATEPLPGPTDRRRLLFFEAAEGGAGVLRRLVDDPGALASVAKQALEICHFDPATGADHGRAPGAREDCEAACYDCLLSYDNQRDHPLLDRKAVFEHLRALAAAKVTAGAGGESRRAHVESLDQLCQSDLEREWLQFIDSRGHRLPDHSNKLVERAGTRPDFLYEGSVEAAIYVDGPVHGLPEVAARDLAQEAALDDLGYTVIRFGHAEGWEATIDRYAFVFGRGDGQP